MTSKKVLDAVSKREHKGYFVQDPHDYEGFLKKTQKWFELQTSEAPNLFQTDVEHLFDTYLKSFPAKDRQHYNCRACHDFIRKYGGLVRINSLGEQIPVMWPASVPKFFQKTVEACRRAVMSAKIVSVFYGDGMSWGIRESYPDGWHHTYVEPPRRFLHVNTGIKTAGQKMAETREEYAMLCRALADFSLSTAKLAASLTEGDDLYRSEKVRGVAKWFFELKQKVDQTKNRKMRENLVWAAVGSAPAGWCHVRSTMIGTLLEDLASGANLSEVTSRFREKMSPLQYQRPSAAPTVGAIERAEKLVERLGIARSLERRFATKEDLELLWEPRPPKAGKASGGVFDHLRTAPLLETLQDTKKITWEKFAKEVLPEAEEIRYVVPYRGPFLALTTAVHPDAPNILQWGNPVAWYLYYMGSEPQQWGLRPMTTVKVMGVLHFPPFWDGATPVNAEPGAIFLLEGMKDSRSSGLALFPETLKSELHEVRSVIEAHSARGKLGEVETPACGVDTRKWDQSFQVKSRDSQIVRTYHIDRWS